jgi:hypothetical protein
MATVAKSRLRVSIPNTPFSFLGAPEAGEHIKTANRAILSSSRTPVASIIVAGQGVFRNGLSV